MKAAPSDSQAISKPPYSAIAVANFFIELANKSEKSDLTPMKLQKLIYYANGWHLALTGIPLIEEDVEAWKFGPVIESIYKEFKRYGNEPVTDPVIEDDDTLGDGDNGPIFTTVAVNSEAAKLLNKIWEIYGKYTAIQLSNATHEPGSPWAVIWDKRGKYCPGVVIPKKLIKAHFESLKVKK
ncbi:MAG: hypothetical protein JWN25_1800 [Verrucomicrobiales bacterium]|nr:hypothetical protein [Verrucomicrobiales bacterium]